MSSSNHTLPSPSISDVMKLLNMMKKQNNEILAKLNSIEDDNRKLRQELLEIKSSHALSKKRNEPEDEKEKYQNEPSSSKKPRVSVASLAEINVPEYGPDTFDHTLDYYCLGELSKGILHYNRRDIFERMLADESDEGKKRLEYLCSDATEESRLDILREVFQRATGRQLEYLRDCDNGIDLCGTAALFGNLECMKLLTKNECEWLRFIKILVLFCFFPLLMMGKFWLLWLLLVIIGRLIFIVLTEESKT